LFTEEGLGCWVAQGTKDMQVDLKSKVCWIYANSLQVVLAPSRQLQVDFKSLCCQVGSDWATKVTPSSNLGPTLKNFRF